MKSMSRIGFALALATASLAANEARAVDCRALAAPNLITLDCTTGTPLRGYKAGLQQGINLSNQVWNSPDIVASSTRFADYKDEMVNDLPVVVLNAIPTVTVSDYVQCRAKGLIDGAACEVQNHNPNLQCGFDGYDWGNISGEIYCNMSIANNGLSAPLPWTTAPATLCSEAFELLCPIAYDHRSTYAALPAAPPAASPFNAWPYIETPIPACNKYTKDPGFKNIYEDSRKYDCTYEY